MTSKINLDMAEGLAGALDRLRLTTVECATFDAGNIHVMYE